MAARASGGLEPCITWRQRRVAVKPRHQVTLSTDDEMPRRRFCKELSMQVPRKTNGTREPRKAVAATTVPRFDAQAFLTSVGAGRSTANYQAKEKVFRQGDPADAVFYIQRGKVNLTVVSEHGKEGVIAMLG